MSLPDMLSASYVVTNSVSQLQEADNEAEQVTAQNANIWSEALSELYENWNFQIEQDTGTSTEDQQKYNTDNTEYQNATTIYNSIVSGLNTSVNNLASSQSQLVQFAQAVMSILTYTSNLLISPLAK